MRSTKHFQKFTNGSLAFERVAESGMVVDVISISPAPFFDLQIFALDKFSENALHRSLGNSNFFGHVANPKRWIACEDH